MEPKALRILIAEDFPADAELCEHELRRGGLTFTAVRAETREAYAAGLVEFKPDLILSDFSMPPFDGMAALDMAREKLPDVPFVFVSGTIGEDRAVEAMRRGATDYVLKERLQRLVPVVKRALQEADERALRRESERALRESQERFRALLEAAPDAIALVDDGGRIALINASMEEMFGYAREELIGRTVDLLVVDDAPLRRAGRRAKYRSNSQTETAAAILNLEGRRKDGSLVPLDVSLSAIELGEETHVIGVIRDVTRRREQELRIARLSRIRQVLGAVNSAIVRIRDRQGLFEEACRIAVGEGGFAMAWIGLVDRGTRAVRSVAAAGDDAEVLAARDPGTGRVDPPLGGGLAVRAIRDGRAVVSNDLLTESSSGGEWRREAVRRGYRSVTALPLPVEDGEIGVLTLFAREPDFFTDEEVKLLAELARDISFALGSIAKAEKLDYLACHDALTDLPNLTLLHERLGQALNDARAHGSQIAVLVFDIKRFRLVNETLGRHAGDALLRELSQRVRRFMPDPNNLARISGDCFVGILPEVRGVHQVAHLLEEPLADLLAQPFVLDGKEILVSLTAGIAMFPGDGSDAESLLKNAEAALRKAKTASERYLFYQPAMNASVAHTLLLENRMRHALEKEQFVLHYQPKIRLADQLVSGAEALIRWNDPETGLVPPARFIPILEETGMILEVGEWAIRQALADHCEWSSRGLAPPRVAVNVSAIQLRRRDFVSVVLGAVEDAGAVPQALELEITESLIMEDIEDNISKLRELRAKGVSIAIDDFGTGYSSLSYLAKLPVNTLKIDRSFIVTLTGEPESRVLVSSIISLARSLKLAVVAEGVDSEAQAQLLRTLACEEVQGYLYSKPLPTDEMLGYLGRGPRTGIR
jgi:PAS domain S-box-containing protein/diguanylate cyclase (GGDEF)-like protein